MAFQKIKRSATTFKRSIKKLIITSQHSTDDDSAFDDYKQCRTQQTNVKDLKIVHMRNEIMGEWVMNDESDCKIKTEKRMSIEEPKEEENHINNCKMDENLEGDVQVIVENYETQTSIEENSNENPVEPIMEGSEYKIHQIIGIDCGTFYSQASYHNIGSSKINDLYSTRITSVFYSNMIGEQVLEITEGQPALSIEYFRKFSNIPERKLNSNLIYHLIGAVSKQIDEHSNKKFITAIPYGWELDCDSKIVNNSTCFEHEAVISYYVAQFYQLDFKKEPDETSLQQFKEMSIQFSIFNLSGTGTYQCIVRKDSNSLVFESTVLYSFSFSGVKILSDFCNRILALCELNYRYENGELKTNDIKDERSAKFTFQMNKLMMNMYQYGQDDEISISETIRMIFGEDSLEGPVFIKRSEFPELTLDENMPIFNSNQLLLVGGLWNIPSLSKFKKGENRRYLNNGSMISVGCILRELMIRNYKVSFVKNIN